MIRSISNSSPMGNIVADVVVVGILRNCRLSLVFVRKCMSRVVYVEGQRIEG